MNSSKRGAPGFAIALVLASSFLVAADDVGVATSVSDPDRHGVVNVTVPVDLIPGSPEIARDLRGLAKQWERAAETYWNNAFDLLSYKCFTLNLDVQFKIRPEGYEGTNGRHRVLVALGGSGTPGFKGTKERNPSAGSKDGTRSFDESRDGVFREDQSDATTAHEVGHLMGLGDDYVEVSQNPRRTAANPGREGTLMADNGVIDQVLVDRVGKQIEKLLGDLEGCETWSGKVTGHLNTPGCTPSTPKLNGTITLNVDTRNRVTGTASYTTEGYTCGGTPAPPIPSEYQITGKKTNTSFKISIGGEPTTMDINNGNSASVSYDTPGAGGYGASIKYSVKCEDCKTRPD